ncbi:MAG: hypothetical protein ACYC6Y_01930 [Thermoguttaceae bacterium]
MTEQELTVRLEECRRLQSRDQVAGDGGVHSIDEVVRELMAAYQPLAPSASSSPLGQLVAC